MFLRLKLGFHNLVNTLKVTNAEIKISSRS